MTLITVRVTVAIPDHGVGDCITVDDSIATIQKLIAAGWLIASTCTPGSSIPFQPGLKLSQLADVAGVALPGTSPVEDNSGFFQLVDVATQAEFDAYKNLGNLTAVFSRSGALSVVAGSGRFPAPRACTIVGVWTAVGTSPTGQGLICDVNKNGATIFSTQANRPTIIAGGSSSGLAVPNTTVLAAGDLLSVDVDQVGSGIAGSDLTAVVLLA